MIQHMTKPPAPRYLAPPGQDGRG